MITQTIEHHQTKSPASPSNIDIIESIKQNFKTMTEIHIENGQKMLQLLEQLGTNQFNQLIKQEFPQQKLTIKQQMLVAQFFNNHPEHQPTIKNFNLEFLCILANTPNSISSQILNSDRHNWTLDQLKQLIKQYKQKIKEQIENNKKEKPSKENQKNTNQKLKQINKNLRAKIKKYQELNQELTTKNQTLTNNIETLLENNRMLQILIDQITFDQALLKNRTEPSNNQPSKFPPHQPLRSR